MQGQLWDENVSQFFVRHRACPQGEKWATQFRSLEDLWRNCKHSEWLLWAIDKVEYRNERKLRLFACACARHFWPLLDDRRSKKAVETAEQFAEGKANADDLARAWTDGKAAAVEALQSPKWTMPLAAARAAAWCTARTAAAAAANDVCKHGIKVAAWAATSDNAAEEEEAWQCNKLREIVAEDVPEVLRRLRSSSARR